MSGSGASAVAWWGRWLLLAGLLGCRESPALAPLPAGIEVAVAHHDDLLLQGSGPPIPWFVRRDSPLWLCLTVPAGLDAAGWRLELPLPGAPRGGVTAHRAHGRTVCFERPWHRDDPPGEREICAQLHRPFEGQSHRLPCVRVRYEPGSAAYRRVWGLVEWLLDRKRSPPPEALEWASEEVLDADFPVHGLKFAARAVDRLLESRAPAALERAGALLEAPPAWLQDPVASEIRGQVEYTRALWLIATGRLEGAWRALARSAEAFERVASPSGLAQVILEAQVLGGVGARREALARLNASLAAAEGEGVNPGASPFVGAAHELIAWLVITDPDATPAELGETARQLAALTTASADPLGRANTWVNRALLAARQGRDGVGELRAARAELATVPLAPGSEAWQLAGWADLAEGWGRLARRDAAAALQACARLADRPGNSSRLAAWAFSCVGRAALARGDLTAAAQAFERAIERHEAPPAEPLVARFPPSPGPHAEDVYRAARVAVLRGDPSRAWHLLSHLDGRDTREVSAGFRAFSAEDEVFLLEQNEQGLIALRARTPFARPRLRQLTEAITAVLDARQLNDEGWRELLAPIAPALLPADLETLGQVTVFSLYGRLQGVPVVALPLPEPASGGARWLRELTAVVVQPGGLAPDRGGPRSMGPPVFLVNPQGDLASGPELATFFAGHIPGGRVYSRADATVAVAREALTRARWVHVTAHGTYDPAFPELSRLELADGAFALASLETVEAREGVELRPLGVELVDLSGCRTGLWPVTADRGHFGLGGALLRAGAEWVIATRADLDDRVGASFSRALYGALAVGRDVPTAWQEALAAVHGEVPAVAWAGLQLLGGGKPPAARLPGKGREMRSMPASREARGRGATQREPT